MTGVGQDCGGRRSEGPRAAALLAVLALLLAAAPRVARARAEPKPKASKAAGNAAGDAKTEAAAAAFERGRKLYLAGRYRAAIAAFSKANSIAEHSATLFAIARCHQNLGQLDQALSFLRRAHALDTDKKRKAGIARRIAEIESRPIDVLINSHPPGARVTVDARARAEARPTPLVLRLRPGAHRILLSLAGHALTAKRFVLRHGTASSKRPEVEVTLQPQAVPVGKAKLKRCAAAPDLVRMRRLHLRTSVLTGAVMSSRRGLDFGFGARLHVTYGQLIVGAHVAGVIDANRSISIADKQYESYKHASFHRVIVQAVAGWAFVSRSFYVYATGGLGALVDRTIYHDPDDDFVRERGGFVWSLGGGIDAMALSWLSFGFALRGGLAHIIDDDIATIQPSEGAPNPLPFAQLWATVTFHL